MIEHVTILSNDAALDEEGWALIAPFGEHPKTRFVKKNGTVRRENFIQVLDQQSADLLLARENSLFRRIRRAVVGIPVYKGHPDLGDFAPETAGGGEKKEIIGAIDRIRKTARGLEAHFILTPAGADAVEREGRKYPSALWYVQPVGRRGGAVLARPFKLLSAGLTAHPNISGVESLANARPAGPTQEHTKEPEMKLIAGWLLANGVTLANADSPAESQVLEALQKLHATAAGGAAALGNENTDLKSRISNLESAKTTLENENGALKTQAAAERKGARQPWLTWPSRAANWPWPSALPACRPWRTRPISTMTPPRCWARPPGSRPPATPRAEKSWPITGRPATRARTTARRSKGT